MWPSDWTISSYLFISVIELFQLLSWYMFPGVVFFTLLWSVIPRVCNEYCVKFMNFILRRIREQVRDAMNSFWK